MILCSFRNLFLSFGTKTLFKGAKLSINEGDRIGLLGLNGMGKSSLFKVLAQKQPADSSTPPFLFDKSNNFSLFHVPQDIPATIPETRTISEIFFDFYPQMQQDYNELKRINESIENGQTSDVILQKQKDILERMEHQDTWSLHQSFESMCKSFQLLDLDRSLKDLSGGQRKKILLSLGLTAQAPLILWDEPTNHLDIDTISQLEEEFLTLNKTLIIVSHDRYLLGKVTNKIFQIENGLVTTFNGGYQDYLALQAEKEVARQSMLNKLRNSFRREDAWMKQGIKARGTRSKKRVENFEEIKSKIGDIKSQARRQLDLTLVQSQRKTKVLLDVKDLSFAYPQKTALFESLHFSLHKGNKIGLLGSNGVGKTTLIRLLQGELSPSQGTIKRADDLKIKVFSQNRTELPLDQTPFEILGDGTDQVSLPGGSTIHVQSYFKKFLFHGDEIHRPLRTFSGGERNRLQLALNLKQEADVWVFDEPTNDLDLESLAILEQALGDFQGSIILISHDRAFLKNITNKVFLLKDQKLDVFEGGYEQVESYLEALKLEASITNEKEEKESGEQQVPITSSPQAPAQTNMNSAQIKKVNDQIAEKEELIEKISGLIQSLGALQSSQETVDKLTQLSSKLDTLEEELLELYEALEG